MPRRTLSGWRASSAIGIGVAWITLVLASHDRVAPDALPQALPRDVQQPAEEVDMVARLTGTWLREHDEQDVRSRRLLHLHLTAAFASRCAS